MVVWYLSPVQSYKQMSKMQQRKGKSGELELLHLLHDRGYPVYRNDQRYVGGMENPDICLRMNGQEFHCEVKRTEKLRLYAAMNQAIKDSNGKRPPLVLHRRNRGEWLAIMRLDDFLNLSEKRKKPEEIRSDQ